MFFFKKKSVVFIENALCFNCYSRPTPTFAGYLSFTRYECKNQKSDNSQLPIILMVVKTFSASYFFGYWFEEPAKNTSTLLEQNQIWRVHHRLQRQQMVTLVTVFGTGWKDTSRGLKKSARTRTIKTLWNKTGTRKKKNDTRLWIKNWLNTRTPQANEHVPRKQ